MKIKLKSAYILLTIAIYLCTANKVLKPLLSQDSPIITISGIVTDSSGNPLPGVTIAVKGRSEKTATNNEGLFTIKTVPASTLIITHVGYLPKELFVSNTAFVKIILQIDATTNENVIVEANTGYQKIKSNEINGSVTVVDNKLLNQQTGTNILDRLNGVTNGMLFNSGKKNSAGNESNDISIRGLSTINGPLSPLIILDNFPYEGDINNINPNDVENVTILKDAAAASIWGARAGNGVIVITTKKARFGERLKVNVNSSFLFSPPVDLYSLPRIKPADYIDVETALFNKGFFDADINNTYNYPALTPVVEVLLKRKNGLISASDSAALINQYKQQDSRAQYSKYFQRTALTQQHSLSVNSGNEQAAWLISGNFNTSANADYSTSNKINLHLGNSYKILKNLLLNIGAYYTNSNTHSGMPGYSSITSVNNRYVPYLNFIDQQGDAMPQYKNRAGYIDTLGAGHLLDWRYYPYTDNKHNYITGNNEEIVTDISVHYTVIPGLTLSADYQYQKAWGNQKNFADTNSYYLSNLINQFTQLSYSQEPDIFPVPKGNMISTSGSQMVTQNFRGMIDFNKVWKNHAVTAIAGMDLRDAKTTTTGAFTVYGYNDDPLASENVDFKNPYPTLITGGEDYIPGAPGMGSRLANRIVSLFSNTSYTFRNRYSINGSFRKDASNVWGATTNDKWNPLWSTGVGWVISNENFFKINFLRYLKARLSYGVSGNLDNTKTPLPVTTILTNPQTNLLIERISNLNNPSLRWEKSKQLNIGIDFVTKSKVLSGSVEYYSKQGSDLYGEAPYDYTAWGRSNTLPRNVANMAGHGWDVNLMSNNLSGAVTWSSNLIYNYNTSKTTKYFTDVSKDFFGPNNGSTIVPIVGMPLYAIAAYKWGGLNANGDPQGYLDGQLSTDYNAIINKITTEGSQSKSLTFIGPASPTHFGSLINNFSWKGFQLSFNIIYKMGYYFFKPSFASSGLILSGVGHTDFYKRWIAPGDEKNTSVPKLVYPDYPQYGLRDNFYQYAAVNVLKGDHIRFHYINASYSFLTRKAGLRPFNIQIYTNISNLGIIWRANKSHIDPDYADGYAPAKQYTIGMRLGL